MRKLNTILSVLLLFICLLHGLMGSFMLLGISSGAGKFLAWIGVGILAAHTVLGLLLTAQTFRASRSGGKLYGNFYSLLCLCRSFINTVHFILCSSICIDTVYYSFNSHPYCYILKNLNNTSLISKWCFLKN